MQRDDLHLPDNFRSIEGKLRVVDDSIDLLLNSIDQMANADDDDEADAIVELLADMSGALVALHMVVAGMLQDHLQCT